MDGLQAEKEPKVESLEREKRARGSIEVKLFREVAGSRLVERLVAEGQDLVVDAQMDMKPVKRFQKRGDVV